VVPGATVTENKRNGTTRTAPGPGGRGRAEQDPVVRRMQEKLGAQVRTVIDYREKRWLRSTSQVQLQELGRAERYVAKAEGKGFMGGFNLQDLMSKAKSQYE